MARGRPATPLGTFGNISYGVTNNGKTTARTRLRLLNGKYRDVEVRGTSKSNAAARLKERCAALLGEGEGVQLSTTSPLTELVNHWLETKDDIRPQSRDRYTDAINRHIVPDIGAIRLNEIQPWRLQEWIKTKGTGTQRTISSVLSQAFKLAVRYQLMTSNPWDVVDLSPIKTKDVRALTRAEWFELRALLEKYHDPIVLDVVDVCLSTGVRAGEVLSLRWQDLDLESEPPVWHVQGTLAYSKELKNARQDDGKTKSSKRSIQLVGPVLEVLNRRRALYGELEMVFPSGAGTYKTESNFNRSFRAARGERFRWVTIHTLRKTVSSLVSDELGPHKAADLLGHADSRLTERVYYERNREGVPMDGVIDRLFTKNE